MVTSSALLSDVKPIPDDKCFGKPKRHDHLDAFGSTVYFRDHRHISKLSPRYLKGLLLGYQEGTHNYRVWDGNKVIITRDVVFINTGDNFVKSGDGTYSAPIKLKLGDDMLDVRDYAPTDSQLDSIKTAGGRNSGDGNFYIHSKERGYNFDDFLGDFQGVLQRNRHRDHLGAGGQLHTPPHSPNPSVQSSHNASPPFNASSGISDASPPISSDSEHNSENDSDDPLALTDTDDPFNYLAHALTASAPSSYREAKASGEWKQWKPAMDAELAKMDQYKVWEVVDRQPNMRVVGACWVYTRRIDGNTGKPTSYKARWVAKGYSQREGIDFNELHAAVAHKDTIRVFLSLVNHLDLECDQVDIEAAFLNGDLEETIYLSPPEGSDIPGNKVLHLRKSLYGLRQSPRCFNKAFDKWLKSQGLTPSKACRIYRRSAYP
jgi:hypothetical protein